MARAGLIPLKPTPVLVIEVLAPLLGQHPLHPADGPADLAQLGQALPLRSDWTG